MKQESIPELNHLKGQKPTSRNLQKENLNNSKTY